MPIQGDQRASSRRSKIDSGRAILPSISGERRIRQGQRLVPLRVPKCDAFLDKKCISAYLFSIGLDDQDPSQLDDADLSHLVVPDADYPSGSEEEGEEEEEEEEDQRGEGGGSAATVSRLVVPDPVLASDSEEEEGEEEEEEEEQQQQEQHQSSPPIDDTPRKRSRK